MASATLASQLQTATAPWQLSTPFNPWLLDQSPLP